MPAFHDPAAAVIDRCRRIIVRRDCEGAPRHCELARSVVSRRQPVVVQSTDVCATRPNSVQKQRQLAWQRNAAQAKVVADDTQAEMSSADCDAAHRMKDERPHL